jgi:AraC-like DNA-binding protein
MRAASVTREVHGIPLGAAALTLGAFPPPTGTSGRAEGAGGNPAADLALAFAAAQGIAISAPPETDVLAQVWRAAAAADIAHPGLAFAAWAEPALVGGVLPTILANCADIGAFLERLHRYHPLFGPERLMYSAERGSALVWLEGQDGSPAHPDTIDAFFAWLSWLPRRLTHNSAGPTRITIRRPAPADEVVYKELLGEVRFGAERDRLTFDARALGTRIDHADPAVLAALEPYAERRIAEQGRAWAALVADLVARDLEALPTLASVSASLAVSPRTLQMRLAEEGTAFSAIVDGVQREKALLLLATSDVPITTVATAVGFSSPAVLSRAVRRWTGLTPTDYRRQA